MTVTVRSPAATSTGFFTERTEFDDSKKKRTESAGDKNLHTKSSPGKPLILACIWQKNKNDTPNLLKPWTTQQQQQQVALIQQ